ncbi:FecR family protein [Chitinophaga sp. CF418]|uniref:FecR family protein n=1 Tax=Chitinophaga sp. CF418 TaxID=1855287 RepID=UPI00122D1746|nr:FecR family protein [Chitinophaga sp. CF418]
MTDNEIILMLERYSKGESSPEEAAAVEAWFNQYTAKATAEADLTDIVAARNRIWQSIGVRHKPVVKLFAVVRYAAAALIVIGGITWFYINHNNNSIHKTLTAQEILPGGNKATLTLANGKKVSLNAQNDTIAIDPALGVLISNDTASGIVTFKYQNRKTEGANRETNSSNTINTPTGGQYKLQLPDGTNVILNALTQITFPSRFVGSTREITLIGEAYFEVAHDPRHPFRVNTADQQVAVLGTHFNVSAYPQQPTKTTLTQGRIKLTQPSTGESQPLNPGQQAELISRGFNVKEVIASDEIAWIDGMFIFSNTPIKEAMQQIARWYDIEVNYQSLPNVQLQAVLSRKLTLAQVLDAIQFSNDYEYKINNERRLEYVRKKGQ